MDLGWLDVCLTVKDVRVSRDFYEKLGFRRVEGTDDEGWAVVVNGESRLGLYEPQHGDVENGFTLNFRGGNIGELVAAIQAEGLSLEGEPKPREDGSGSANLRDPDGYKIFFDSSPGETKKS